MTVAALKDRIRAKGAADRLADCIEKKDLIECLVQLTPLSPMPLSPQPVLHQSTVMSEGVVLPANAAGSGNGGGNGGSNTSSGSSSVAHDALSAPNSRSGSRHNSRPSSPDLMHNLHSLNSQLGSSTTAARDAKDPFADLFAPTSGAQQPVSHSSTSPPSNGHMLPRTAQPGSMSHATSHHLHDVPSPTANHFSHVLVHDQLSPTRHPTQPNHSAHPAHPTISTQRPQSIPVSVRTSSNRNTSHPLSVVPPQPYSSTTVGSVSRGGSPLPPHPFSASSSILPSDPFAHLDAQQLTADRALPTNWHDYFSDQADKHASNHSASARPA